MPKQQALPIWVVLNTANDAAASGMNDVFTGYPYEAGGLGLGDYFDLTSKEAFRNCKPSVSMLYFGRYRRIKVSALATAAQVATGTIGFMAPPADAATYIGKIGGANPISANIITSYAGALNTTVRPVVFLNAITPGNFGFVQELGVASVMGAAGITGAAIGNLIAPAAGGLAAVAAAGAFSIGVAIDVPVSGALFRVLLQGVPIVQD